LALLSELHYYQATKDNKYKEAREDWVNAILSMKLEGKGFQADP